MSNKLYAVIGHSTRNGTNRIRVSSGNAAVRGKVLLKTGNSNVVLFNLPYPMPKADAQEWLANNQTKGIVPAFQG
jgi:CYTH domain-containing protein